MRVNPPQTNATLVAIHGITKATEWNSDRSTASARWEGSQRIYFRQKTSHKTTGTSQDSGSSRNVNFMSEITKTREAWMAPGSPAPQENEVISYVLDGDDTVHTARVLASNIYRMGHLSSSRHLQLQTA